MTQKRVTLFDTGLHGASIQHEDERPTTTDHFNEKRTNEPVESIDNETNARDLHRDAPTSSRQYMQQRRGSVWSDYRHCFELDLNGTVDVAVSRTAPARLVVVRRTTTVGIHRRTDTLTELMKEPCFAKCFEVFGPSATPSLVCEYLSMNLGHVLALPLFPTELEMAAVAGQLLHALEFLESRRLAHQKLQMSNILLSDEGLIKIADPELCDLVSENTNGPKNVQDVGDLIWLLATKTTDRARTPQEGRYSSVLLDFIGACLLQPATSLVEACPPLAEFAIDTDVLQHDLLKNGWRPADLTPLVAFSQVASRRFFGLPWRV